MQNNVSVSKSKVVIFFFILLAANPWSATAAFNARLQGQSRGTSAWIGGNLQGWRDLDEIPCRVYLTGGPANNKTITVEFDRMQGRNPGIENLSRFAPSPNVVITSKPVLSSPRNSSRWTYTFTVKLLDKKPGCVKFNARLAPGCHQNGGSSVGMRGSPSLGNLQIHKPAPRAGEVDLALLKTGPSQAAPGETITYTLQYSNKPSATITATGVQVSDIVPPQVAIVSGTLGTGQIVGNMIVWKVGNLAPGATGTLSYSVRVNDNVPFGQVFTNSAFISSAHAECKCDQNAHHDDDDDDDGHSDDDDGNGKCDDDDDQDGDGKCDDDGDDHVRPCDSNLDDNRSSVTTRVVFNRAPVANPDSYQGSEDEPLIVPAPGVLANDTDPDNDPLTAILVSGPAHGTVTLNLDGSFIYTPNADFDGQDTFTYKANDGLVDSPATSVLILLQPRNEPPVAVNDQYRTSQNSVLNVPVPGVLANDFDADQDALIAILLSGPSQGTVTLNANGSFQYMPTRDFTGTDTFTYKANDGQADSQPAMVTITIEGVTVTNQPPVVSIVHPTNGTIYIEGMDITLVAEASDSDGTIARVDFYNHDTFLGSATEAPYSLLLSNVAAGEYVFRAVATDDSGATAISDPVAVLVLEHPPFVAGDFRLNRQTGLFEQTVTVSNPTPFDFQGIRLWIMDVRSGATVWNATGQSEGVPYIDVLLTIPPGASVDIRIEYYTPDVRIAPQPTFLPEVL